MLMHSCYCVFISVTGGFVQMLKDLKNLLKMSLKILFIKRKRKISFHLLPFLVFGPFPSAGPSPPRSPARPPPPLRATRPSNSRLASPAAPPAQLASNRRRLPSLSAADDPAPPVSAAPHLQQSRACARPSSNRRAHVFAHRGSAPLAPRPLQMEAVTPLRAPLLPLPAPSCVARA